MMMPWVKKAIGWAGRLNFEDPVIGDRVSATAIENRIVDDNVAVAGAAFSLPPITFALSSSNNEARGIGLNRSADVGDNASVDIQARYSEPEQGTGIGDVVEKKDKLVAAAGRLDRTKRLIDDVDFDAPSAGNHVVKRRQRIEAINAVVDSIRSRNKFPPPLSVASPDTKNEAPAPVPKAEWCFDCSARRQRRVLNRSRPG